MIKVMKAAVFTALGKIEIRESWLSLEELRVTEGQARSSFWNQIKADITGKQILVAETGYSELIGVTCVALGEYETLGHKREGDFIKQASLTADSCEKRGMPLMIEAMVSLVHKGCSVKQALDHL
ncbi:MAG TPA: hypothetical protein ENI15_10415 [Spirochaetes bacterium]|nr:hypothetical protein [Spirochaetota bacterium]